VLGAEVELRNSYVKEGQLRILFNPMLDLGQNSTQAVLAAECAGEQGQFWAMHDLLFERQREIYGADPGNFKALAAELEIDREAFDNCFDEQRYVPQIEAQDEARRQAGVRIRPSFEINGQFVAGAQSIEAFAQVIDPLVAQ
jgi:protein-disulfide isomerase